MCGQQNKMLLQITLKTVLCFMFTLTSAYEHNNGKMTSNEELMRVIFSYNDRTANPCENFYQYACGNFPKLVHEHEKKEYTTFLGLISYNANKEFKTILESTKDSVAELNFVQNVLNYYNSCKNVSEDSHQYNRILTWLTNNEEIKYPNIEQRSEYDWPGLLTTLRRYGLNGLFWELTELSSQNRWIINLNKPLIKNDFKRFTKTTLKRMLGAIDVNILPFKQSKKNSLINNIKHFEDKLILLREMTSAGEYSNFTLKDFNMTDIEQHMAISWKRPHSRSSLNALNRNAQYFINVLNTFKTLDSNFVGFYLVLRFLNYIDKEAPIEFQDIKCVQNTRVQLQLAMNWLYANNMHEQEYADTIQDVTKLFNNLKKKFTQTLRINLNNFAPLKVAYLAEKVMSMRLRVDNIPRQNATVKIENFYANISLSGHNFYDNLLKLLRFNAEKQLESQKNTINLDKEDFYISEKPHRGKGSSNYYLRTAHTIMVPLAFLKFPKYHIQFNDLFKYSGLGKSVAHEILHGFDEHNLESSKWRKSSETIRKNAVFKSSVECLSGSQPNHNYNIDERIADASGLRLAFEAFFDSYIGTADSLMKLDKELFFVNYAISFCGNHTVSDGIHGTLELRLDYALSHFSEFARTFNCSVGSPMNPEKKCQLWR